MKRRLIVIFIILMLILISVNVNASSDECDCLGASEDDPEYYLGDIYEGEPPTGTTIFGNAPSSFDWRDYNDKDWTTPVKNQGECGSCYAFGTIAALESVVKIKLNRPDLNVDLSEQYMVSCGYDWGYNEGCDGGQPTPSYEFIADHGAIPESFFPYTSGLDIVPYCSDKYNDCNSFKTEIAEWEWIFNDVESIQNALVEYGPLPTSMYVYDDFFSTYEGGIYSHAGDESDKKTNHRVTIVGYNDDPGYWVCKNSWGKDWGENGWFRIAYGECRIEDFTVFFDLGDISYYEIDLDFNMHKIKMLGEIEGLGHGEGAEWNYRVSVWNGLCLEHITKLDYSNEQNEMQWDITHTFNLHTLILEPVVLIKVWDWDEYIIFLDDSDLADVSGANGGGKDDDIDDKRGAMFQGTYDIVTDSFISGDTLIDKDGWKTTSGTYSPDNSQNSDSENDAMVWFSVTDYYDIFTPSAGGPYYSLEGFDIEISGSAQGSEAPFTFEWDLDDDGDFDDSTSQSFSYSWASAGSYPIKLKVTDSIGVSRIDQATVEIKQNSAPNKPSIDGPSTGNADSLINYKFTGTDPDEEYGDKIFFKIDWGDGSITDWIGPYDSGYSLEKSHSWERQRNPYTLRAKIKDLSDRESGWKSMEVTMPRTFNPISNFIKRFPGIYQALNSVLNLLK